MSEIIKQFVEQKTTTAVAAGAVTSPAWLPSLAEWSAFAAMMMPILGVIWLACQIVRAAWNALKGN